MTTEEWSAVGPGGGWGGGRSRVGAGGGVARRWVGGGKGGGAIGVGRKHKVASERRRIRTFGR